MTIPRTLPPAILRSLAESVAYTRKAFLIHTPNGIEEISREEWINQMVETWTDMEYNKVFDMVDHMTLRR